MALIASSCRLCAWNFRRLCRGSLNNHTIPLTKSYTHMLMTPYFGHLTSAEHVRVAPIQLGSCLAPRPSSIVPVRTYRTQLKSTFSFFFAPMQHAAKNTGRRFQIPGHTGFPLIGSILGGQHQLGCQHLGSLRSGEVLVLEEHSVVTDWAFISKDITAFELGLRIISHSCL